jgi:superfamily II DNA or RNA helicase
VTVELTLRAWQRRFARQLAAHDDPDFMLVACPAAGKTIGAGAAIAEVMRERDCDQLIVVCPTVVVRSQWATVLNDLGYRMAVSTAKGKSWPEHQHGVCMTYAAVSWRAGQLAEACRRRRTAVILDEIHHAGEQEAWGRALEQAFGDAAVRLVLSGTPFRSDRSRIPFVRYDDEGVCVPDFTYDYPRAVRDGVCRTIEFKAHDGEILWENGDGEAVPTTFGDELDVPDRARRLRASLDPTQPYLAALLSDAHQDLLALRARVPDAAGLVVCDSQAHALEVEQLLGEIIDGFPAVAISDQPHAHQAIREFAASDRPWLVSVRMVSEGVDIPRLGVIAWATAARTELMVRQVAGRALRGHGDHAGLPAVVHMPADPQLVLYARRLNELSGSPLKPRDRGYAGVRGPRAAKPSVCRGVPWIDPTPFLEWFDRMAKALGANEVARRCGLTIQQRPGHGGHQCREVGRWRHDRRAVLYAVYEACFAAGIDFESLFSGPEYAEARDILERGPELRESLRALSAQPTGTSAERVVPPLPAGRVQAVTSEAFEVQPPVLPPSPEEVAQAAAEHRQARADLFRKLATYVRLRQAREPAFQLATAHRELMAAAGRVGPESSDEQLDSAVRWLDERLAVLARSNPDALRELARERRRLANG